jgi:dTDP-4-dehydrorhamnose 3,5-epimerase
MKIIEGVVITPLKTISVPEGDVFHGLKASESSYRGFGEAYFSSIKPLVIKSWKRHNKMTLNLVVIMGSIRFVMHDDRPTSSTFGVTQECVIGPNTSYARLTVPPGVWMAFQGLAGSISILLNVADIPHDPLEVDRRELTNFAFQWSGQ